MVKEEGREEVLGSASLLCHPSPHASVLCSPGSGCQVSPTQWTSRCPCRRKACLSESMLCTGVIGAFWSSGQSLICSLQQQQFLFSLLAFSLFCPLESLWDWMPNSSASSGVNPWLSMASFPSRKSFQWQPLPTSNPVFLSLFHLGEWQCGFQPYLHPFLLGDSGGTLWWKVTRIPHL